MIKKAKNKSNFKNIATDNMNVANGSLADNNVPYGFKEDSFNSEGLKTPRALLIIINYNGINFIGECLDSIYSQSYKEIEVLVADNNSKDGSVNFIRENYPQCEVLTNRQNKGYGIAINKAVKYGLKKYGSIDYFAILNNDLRLEPHWLENLINYGQKKPECGILAGKMLIYYWPKYINSTGGLVNYFGSGWDRDFFELDKDCQRESGEVLSVSGGAMLIKKGVFDSVGFFESKYFMYYEDIDFCFKTWKYSNFSVDYVKDALVYHKFSASSGVMSLKKHFYLKRARFIFILRNYPIGFLAKIIPQITRYEFGFIMKDLLARYDFVNFFREFYVFLIFLAKLPVIIGKRLLTKDNKSRINSQKTMRMWNMVSTTTTNSGRKFIPMQYLDILWNKFEKYGEKTNRIIMGINDKGIGKGWKSLITNGNPRGRFFFNYADIVLENPYRGENYKYYFQLQYFFYDKKEEILSVNIEGQLFSLRLKAGMNTAVMEIPNEILKDQKEISIIFSFDGNDSAYDKKNTNFNSNNYLSGNMEKMNNFEFKEYVQNFKDLFVIEVALLSEDSQYLRKELSEL
ncbi:MAG: glycosyltransferase family 2 protein [Candidatus Humimicrobiaceae bacterium]